jgi:hypothetical protein
MGRCCVRLGVQRTGRIEQTGQDKIAEVRKGRRARRGIPRDPCGSGFPRSGGSTTDEENGTGQVRQMSVEFQESVVLRRGGITEAAERDEATDKRLSEISGLQCVQWFMGCGPERSLVKEETTDGNQREG